VPLIEDKNIKAATSEVLDLINQHKDADGLILGCTHYAILKDGIREGVGQARLQIISQDEIIPERLRDYLERHQEIETLLSKNSKRNIYLTKHSDRYDHLLQELLVGSFVVRE
jgi:glutamate racemase